MNTLPHKFTIRVYGLLIHKGAVLLSRENIKCGIYTKFPGGGLEFGEGTIDCLHREFMEEAQAEIEVLEHFYTTEDFVPSAFGSQCQVISIYYRVRALLPELLSAEEPHARALKNHGDQILFWQPMGKLKSDDVDLPIDKIVVRKLTETT